MLLDDEAEAGAYAVTALRAWATTPGALRWLAEHARSGYARLLVHRQPAQEDVPDAAFLSALEALLYARALELELETRRTSVPGLLSIFAVSGEEDAIRALVHLLAEGGALTNALVVEVEDEEDAGPFRELGVKTVLETDELPE